MLLFDHFPKAGGTTIRRYLLKCFAPDDIFNLSPFNPGDTRRDFLQLPPHEQRRFKCLLAHGGRSLHGKMAIGTELVTTLREPVDRVVSWYHYARHTEASDAWSDANEMDLISFAEGYDLGHSVEHYFGSLSTLQKHYSVVGDQSNLIAFANAVQHRYGLALDFTEERANRNPQRRQPTAAELQKLKQICADDVRLYECWKAGAGPDLVAQENQRHG
ncbi:MAG: hypothetical protein Fues2KO_47380 [Fuerstiella sp.]